MEDEDNGLEGQEAKRTVNIFSVLDDASAKKQKGKRKFDEDEDEDEEDGDDIFCNVKKKAKSGARKLIG